MKSFLLVASMIGVAFAWDVSAGTPRENALKLRDRIRTQNKIAAGAKEEFKLPISRGFDQKDTSLCWVYSFLNAQETLHRQKNPDSKLELSRAAFQARTMEDRMERFLQRTPNMMKESGTPVDAWALGQKYGLIEYSDFHDIVPKFMGGAYQIVSSSMMLTDDVKEQTAILQAQLEKIFGVIPVKTHLADRELTPLELMQEVFGDQQWISYAPGKLEDFGPHADSDARPESKSFFTSLERIKGHVYASLKAGRPVNYTANGHVVLIYGGSYDAKGRAIKFYIKDSYPPFFYQADAAKLFRELVEVTMLK